MNSRQNSEDTLSPETELPKKGQQSLAVSDDLSRDLMADIGKSRSELGLIKQGSGSPSSFFQSPKKLAQSVIERKITTVQYLRSTLCQSLGITDKQAAGLLENNQKFLLNFCVKGSKGADYTTILHWYQLLNQNVEEVANHLMSDSAKPHLISEALSIIKSGLFSKNPQVARWAGTVLSKIGLESQHNRLMIDLQLKLYKWFTETDVARKSKDKPFDMTLFNLKIPKKEMEMKALLQEPGLRTFIRSRLLHEKEMADIFISSITSFGGISYLDTLTTHLKGQFKSNKEYLKFITDMLQAFMINTKGRAALVNSGALAQIMQMCFTSISLDYSPSAGIVDIEER